MPPPVEHERGDYSVEHWGLKIKHFLDPQCIELDIILAKKCLVIDSMSKNLLKFGFWAKNTEGPFSPNFLKAHFCFGHIRVNNFFWVKNSSDIDSMSKNLLKFLFSKKNIKNSNLTIFWLNSMSDFTKILLKIFF